MKKLTRRQVDRYRSLLKADRVDPIETPFTQGPIGWLAIAAEVEKRLRST